MHSFRGRFTLHIVWGRFTMHIVCGRFTPHNAHLLRTFYTAQCTSFADVLHCTMRIVCERFISTLFADVLHCIMHIVCGRFSIRIWFNKIIWEEYGSQNYLISQNHKILRLGKTSWIRYRKTNILCLKWKSVFKNKFSIGRGFESYSQPFLLSYTLRLI